MAIVFISGKDWDTGDDRSAIDGRSRVAAALAAVGPDGPVLNEAIARVVLDRSKHEFVNGLVVQRWESHIAIHSVDFP